MTMPEVDEYPAKLWPPLRTAMPIPCSRANAITSATSSGPWQRTTAYGRGSPSPAMKGTRASWYAAEPGSASSPDMARRNAPHPGRPPALPDG